MKAEEFDRRFDSGEDITRHLDMSGARRLGQETKRVNGLVSSIQEKLKTLDPYKIVLFGSVAKNDEDVDSDIDLLIVLDSNEIPQDYHDKMLNKIRVRNCIYDISKEIPIDLIVYTKAEYEIIRNNPNSFFHSVERNGKILYEKAG